MSVGEIDSLGGGRCLLGPITSHTSPFTHCICSWAGSREGALVPGPQHGIGGLGFLFCTQREEEWRLLGSGLGIRGSGEREGKGLVLVVST